jgi:hypothetical protein
MPDFVAITAIVCIFGIPMSIPLLRIWTRHQSEMLQLRLRLQQGEGNSHTDIAALRQEIQVLRETSMQYDLSFDAALQRLEQRVARSEQNAQYRPSYETNEANGITAGLHNGN